MTLNDDEHSARLARISQAKQRYLDAAHAVQTGVAFMLERSQVQGSPSREGSAKDLRVGLNMALCDNSALAKLLIAKGVISEEEYLTAVADEAEAEAKRYEVRLKEVYGVEIKLA